LSDVLCVYYSRTGNTKRVIEEVGRELDAEVVRINDAVERTGWKGFFRCGLDAVRAQSGPLLHFETDRPLEEYRLVILGTPVWAGRCSSIARSFLKTYGKKLPRIAYVVTRSGEGKFQEVYRQMDSYVPEEHKAAVSLRTDSVGYCFWQEEFLRQIREYLGENR
jgi:menaquinone-dependent protoporphyrinogen IX oxidase